MCSKLRLIHSNLRFCTQDASLKYEVCYDYLQTHLVWCNEVNWYYSISSLRSCLTTAIQCSMHFDNNRQKQYWLDCVCLLAFIVPPSNELFFSVHDSTGTLLHPPISFSCLAKNTVSFGENYRQKYIGPQQRFFRALLADRSSLLFQNKTSPESTQPSQQWANKLQYPSPINL